MRRIQIARLAMAAAFAVSINVSAATFSTVGDSVAVDYTGDNPDLTATTLYELAAIEDAGATWVFTGTLENTSSISSRISIAGFNTSGLLDLPGSTASGGFSQVGAGAMPGGSTVDFCVKNSGGSNCAGGGGSGVWNTDSPLAFTFTIHLGEGVEALDLSDYAVRFQAAAGPGNLALVTQENFSPAVIPLPAAGWLFLSALGGIGATRYFRRRAAQRPTQV